jgi:hypothetical protein
MRAVILLMILLTVSLAGCALQECLDQEASDNKELVTDVVDGLIKYRIATCNMRMNDLMVACFSGRNDYCTDGRTYCDHIRFEVPDYLNDELAGINYTFQIDKKPYDKEEFKSEFVINNGCESGIQRIQPLLVRDSQIILYLNICPESRCK